MDYILNLLGQKDKIFHGKERSYLWPKVRSEFLKNNPKCVICGGTKKLQVHHIKPYHIFPDLELDIDNLITLCTENKILNCHLVFGHLGNFETKYNENIKEDSKIWSKRLSSINMIELNSIK